MPFGKRGLSETEIETKAEAKDGLIILPSPPVNPSGLQQMIWWWKVCHLVPSLRGVVSFGHQAIFSGILGISILFIDQDRLSRFADALKPYWPLLQRAEPYMDSHGHHQVFLWMSAMYFKDAVLAIMFFIRNLFWIVPQIVTLAAKYGFSFGRLSWLGLFGLLVFCVYFYDSYYGPPQIPASHRGNPVFTGDVLVGLVFPALFWSPFVVLCLSYSFRFILFGDLKGQKIINVTETAK